MSQVPPRSPLSTISGVYLLALLAHRSEADAELTFASAGVSAGADIDCSGCGLVAVSAGAAAGALGDASAGALVVASVGLLTAPRALAWPLRQPEGWPAPRALD